MVHVLSCKDVEQEKYEKLPTQHTGNIVIETHMQGKQKPGEFSPLVSTKKVK